MRRKMDIKQEEDKRRKMDTEKEEEDRVKEVGKRLRECVGSEKQKPVKKDYGIAQLQKRRLKKLTLEKA